MPVAYLELEETRLLTITYNNDIGQIGSLSTSPVTSIPINAPSYMMHFRIENPLEETKQDKGHAPLYYDFKGL